MAFPNSQHAPIITCNFLQLNHHPPAQAVPCSADTRAPTQKSSCRSLGEREFDLSNCVVAREAIIRLELQSDARIGLADEERCLPRYSDASYVTLGENARSHLPFCAPQNEPDKHRLSRREVLSALSDGSAILHFSSAPVPAGLNPPVILCPTSFAGLTSVQVKTPRLFCGCSAAIAPAAMPRTDAMIRVAYRISL